VQLIGIMELLMWPDYRRCKYRHIANTTHAPYAWTHDYRLLFQSVALVSKQKHL